MGKREVVKILGGGLAERVEADEQAPQVGNGDVKSRGTFGGHLSEGFGHIFLVQLCGCEAGEFGEVARLLWNRTAG